MARRRLPHIFLRDSAQQSNYTSPASRGREPNIPSRKRIPHSQRLIRSFEHAWAQVQQNREKRTALTLPTSTGFYLEFRSQPGYDLITKSLDDMRSENGVRILNVRTEGEEPNQEIIATVYVPAGKERHFLDKIEKYTTEIDSRSNKPKNFKLIESIENIRLAILDSFWQDPPDYMPDAAAKWCEIWIRTGISKEEAQEIIAGFKSLCGQLNIEYQNDYLLFPERAVILVNANRNTLMNLIESSDNIAEFRLAKNTARFLAELPPKEQAQWVQNLRNRLHVNQNSNVAVTILDTGVNNGHELLSPVLADADCLTHNEAWRSDDHQGHGTNMAGVVAYGDLQKELERTGPVEINHKLESVKILPPEGDNNPREWGAITQQAISRVEIQSADRKHIGCMAITSDHETDKGRPSSWSAAIDAMTAGYLDDTQRLFIVSAGNVDEQAYNNYPNSNKIESVENPGQSWNALTIGAFTNKNRITDPNCQDHQILAPAGGLSPYSTTSLVWARNKWPHKPDIVFEGGNLSKSPSDSIGELPDLESLTTHHKIAEGQFNTICGTSSATAQAAWVAAQIQASYPQAWPETIRGLMIHSAQWSDMMFRQFNIHRDRKEEISNLLKIFGYGVPDLNDAISCAGNSLTLIAQEYIQPFDKKYKRNEQDRDVASGYRTKDMHIHELPWPKEILLGLGEIPVKLRITLSYFIEPGPGEVGWKDRYRYASHALRFDLNNFTENRRDFLKRLNRAARDEEYNSDIVSDSGSERWIIGKQNRQFGSIHSDIWEGTAAAIATCNLIGVYPVIGWWRERHHLGRWNRRTRYSLIVSLHTPAETVDLYTPVANLLKIPIKI